MLLQMNNQIPAQRETIAGWEKSTVDAEMAKLLWQKETKKGGFVDWTCF